MNRIYPHSSPIVLSDDTFVLYGGQTGGSTPAQRTAAYMDAEKRATSFINSFLLPTTITGTFYPLPYKPFVLDYAYVHSIGSVVILSRDLDSDCSITETSKCAYIRDSGYGVIDVNYSSNNICGCNPSSVYQVRVAYTAGLPSGTITQPDYLAGLVTLADIALQEISGLGGNEAPGDIGVQRFSNQGYAEERIKLGKTTLGSSPRAHRVVDTLMPLKMRRFVGL